jgi:hypothetical protein
MELSDYQIGRVNKNNKSWFTSDDVTGGEGAPGSCGPCISAATRQMRQGHAGKSHSRLGSLAP